MKLKNKLILIFIFFVCFVVFNNSNCFAGSLSKGYINARYNKSTSFDDTISFCLSNIISADSSTFLYIFAMHIFTDGQITGCDVFLSQSPFLFSTTSSGFNVYSDNPEQLYWFTVNYSSDVHKRWFYYQCGDNLVATISTLDRDFFTNHDIYQRNSDNILFYNSLQPETTKQDLFQLNLTDKNFNNAIHTFNLNTDENFVNYSEITDLIENNNKYCIYVTDYTRLLTFSDNSFNATLEGGSYLLSGYIDFLVSDNAYFYFSPHYNRLKVCPGDYYYGLVTDSIKRYFFNLVYSDDSDDTYFTISDDNGLLWCLSDFDDNTFSQTEAISDFKNVYFIGSNQTIYYANEDSNYILDSLTDSIYYGKDRGADERIYNFGFSGGNTKEFYLNEAIFDDNVSSENSAISEKSPVVSSEETFEPVIIHDESSGNSSVIPQDSTTYTYPANTVTDQTTPEEDATHRQNERTSYTSTDSNDDTSNWSLWDFIKGIFGKIGNLISSIANLVSDLISGLVSLFVPSGDFFSDTFTDLGDWFELKLGFIFYPFQFFLDVFDRITNIEFGEPVISIPDITEPFSDEIIIHSVEFNFNDLLENEGIETAHHFYLMFVDAILIIGFINLLKNKFEEVTRR